MGQSIPGTKQIKYKTKDGIPISYIFFDLKGKTRFPVEPSNEAQVNAMFEMTLSDIQANQQQINQLKAFNNKYRYRFVIMHKKLLEDHNARNTLTLSTVGFIMDNVNHQQENKSEQKRIKLKEKLEEIESSSSPIKMALNSLDKLITEQKAHYEFIQVDGINRILDILKKQIKSNLQGFKTNFSNQIDILRFLKSFSSHHPKQFYANIEGREDYGNIILETFHPICTPVTAYCLSLLEDYIQRAEDCKKIMVILKQYAKKDNYPTFLTMFTETLETSSNILMVFYILKFLNQIMAATVDENDVATLRQEMNSAKYTFIIEAIKMKLQENFYKIDACTFISVSQQIYKYASKGKKQYQNSILNPETFAVRNTLSMKDLQQQLVMSFLDLNSKTPDAQDRQSDDNQQDFMTVYLGQSSKKQFNRFVLDVLSQIRTYYKLQFEIDATNNEEYGDDVKQQTFMEKKINDIKLEEYLKHIRANCIKNDCTQIMFGALKNLQYFERSQWKKLDTYILQEIGLSKKGSSEEIQALKKTVKQKEELIKKLIKENIDLKAQIAAKSKEVVSQAVSNAALILPPPPSLNSTAISPPSSIPNLLPPLPPPPSLNWGLDSSGLSACLPPPPSLSQTLSTFPSLPPPPSLGQTLSALPPPPSLGSVLGNLPPPPSLGDLPNLPPLPGDTLSLLPPLPPPPSLDGLSTLPPPPSLGDLNSLPPLPPSSSLSSSDLNLPPPPPPIGSSSSSLPPLPTPPILGGSTQKVKQKKKPKVPLKNLNYAVLSYDKIKGTIWQQVDDEKITLDYSQMEELFSKKVEQKKQLKSLSMVSLPSNQQKKQPIKLIGAQRWRNVEIILTKLKIPKGEISKNLIQCNGKYCTPTTLQSIKNILPTEEEEQMIKMYSGDLNDLGKPELFYKELLTVPEYGHRIKAIIFASHKDESYYEITQKMEQLTQSFVSLQNNYRLHYILQVALAVGNYLNGTSLKGGAWGFKLDSIERLDEVKSADNKMNAAFFVIKEVWKKFEYPMFSKDELDMYQYLSKMPTSQVSAELGELRKILASVRKAQKSQMADNPNDCIGKFCEEMRKQLQMKVDQFTQMMKKLQAAYHQCANFYCEDSRKLQSDEFGKKIFKCIHFIFESQRTYKVVQDKNKKQEERKAIKSQIKFVQKQEPKKMHTTMPPKPNVIEQTGLPLPPKSLPKPPEPEILKEQKLKQYEKSQKKDLEDLMKKRQTKVVAYRKSKAPNGNLSSKNDFQDINFLRGLK